MTMKTRRLMALGLGLVLLSLCVAVAAQVVKKAQQADITSEKFTYDWAKNQFVFSGNCRVDIKGPDKATLNAPRMVGKVASKSSQISEIAASGPVSFDIVTARDSEGNQRHIVATCSGSAVYNGATRLVTLNGGAQATMTTLPLDPSVQPTRFTGDKLVVDFGANEITGENVHFEVEVPAQETTPAAPATTPAVAPAGQ
jgi:lipopolysaccharide export system protein LptA